MIRLLLIPLWFIMAIAMLFMVTQPVSLETHFITSIVVIVTIGVLKMFSRRGIIRAVVVFLGISIVLRYVYWRSATTIPSIYELQNFVPGIILYVGEMFSVLMLFLSLFAIADPLHRRKRTLPANVERPTVDIFVPSLNEDPKLLATTLAAATQIDYPADKLNVYLLDDGGTDQRIQSDDPAKAEEALNRRVELSQLAERLGVHYVTREKNTNAKAGNLNHGLGVSEGEFVVVFDADHAPTRDFLYETLGYFEADPKLFMVQTPHFFINPDPLEHNLETWNRMPSENEMFYAVVQKGLDKWNASFFCGSASVMRREALEEVGGFSGSSITEDCETSLELHSRGWNSAYVDRPMIAGLQPETFASFIGQRSRWCQGMMQIFILKNPLFKRGLSIAQRICYLSSMMYWLFPIPRLIFLFAPLCFLFFGLSIFDASGAEFAAYTITYILVNIMLQNYEWSRVRWPFISELYETIQSVYLIRALGAVILNPRKPTFKVTAKGETKKSSRISALGGPFYIIWGFLFAGFIATVWRLITQPFEADVILVVGGWNLFNLLIMGAALGVVAERRQLRTSQRVAIDRPAEIVYAGSVIPAEIEDVSISGARISVPANTIRPIELGENIIMRFQPMAPLESNELALTVRSIVREQSGTTLGAEFFVHDLRQHKLVADLVFANSDEWVRFQASRRKDISVIRGIVEFVSLSIYQMVRGLAYLVTVIRPKKRKGRAPAKGGRVDLQNRLRRGDAARPTGPRPVAAAGAQAVSRRSRAQR